MKSTDQRIALCLYGRFNNRYSESAGLDGAQYIKKHILQGKNVDVFVYSNDLLHEDEIRDSYSDWIADAKFESSPDFNQIILEAGIDEKCFTPIEPFRTAANSLNFFYSRKMSLLLMDAYAREHEIEYDIAVCSRFDLGQIDRYNGEHPYKVSEINFNENLDMSYIYSAMWDQLNDGYADQWFYSSPKNLLKLGEMYDRTLVYLTPKSSYDTFLKMGILDSSQENLFSNEMLQPEQLKSSNLVCKPFATAINNHLLHKFYFIESGLYEKSRFISEIPSTAHVLYTHSDYKDVWPAYFGESTNYFQGFGRNYVLVDKYCLEIPGNYTQIIYDDTKPYVDRLIDGLKKVPEKTIFFDHEDMILFNFPNMSSIRKYAKLLDGTVGNNSNYDFIRMLKGGKHFFIRSFQAPKLYKILKFSKWQFSIQPSFWRKDRFISLLSLHRGQHIWEFEAAAQKSCKKLRISGAYSHSGGKKRGQLHWDNKIYPFIATAIVKGKWNTSEYQHELEQLFIKYEIDPEVRGTA